jgi:hypothetical protein
MDQARIHFDLQLDVGSRPVTGELVPRGGTPTPFTGYAGLIAALGRISGSGAAGTTVPAPDGDDAEADR